jgi:hypothetical protein
LKFALDSLNRLPYTAEVSLAYVGYAEAVSATVWFWVRMSSTIGVTGVRARALAPTTATPAAKNLLTRGCDGAENWPVSMAGARCTSSPELSNYVDAVCGSVTVTERNLRNNAYV